MAGLGEASAIFSCIALAGQVAKGCRTIWEFTEDAKDSSKEIKALKEELKLTQDVSASFAVLLEAEPIDDLILTRSNSETALNSCVQVVAELKIMLSKYKPMRKRSKMKFAWQKERVLEQVNRLGTARSLVMSAQNNVLIELQRNESRQASITRLKTDTNNLVNANLLKALNCDVTHNSGILQDIHSTTTMLGRSMSSIDDKTDNLSSNLNQLASQTESQNSTLIKFLQASEINHRKSDNQFGSLENLMGQLYQLQGQLMSQINNQSTAASTQEALNTASSSKNPEENIIKIIDHQIVIARSGKTSHVAYEDATWVLATPSQKKALSQLVICARLLEHFRDRYTFLLYYTANYKIAGAGYLMASSVTIPRSLIRELNTTNFRLRKSEKWPDFSRIFTMFICLIQEESLRSFSRMYSDTRESVWEPLIRRQVSSFRDQSTVLNSYFEEIRR